MRKTNILKLKTDVDRTMNGSVFYLGGVLVFAMLSSSADGRFIGRGEVATPQSGKHGYQLDLH
jgi:hypothetical protein